MTSPCHIFSVCLLAIGTTATAAEDRSVIPAYKTDTAPTIDGLIDMGEWDAAGPPIVVTLDSPNAQIGGDITDDPYGGAEDLSYQFRAMWEEPFMVYALFEVTDDIAMEEDPVNLWERDQIELFIDGNDLEGNDDAASFHWWDADEPYGKFGVSRFNTFEGNTGVMTTGEELDSVVIFDPLTPILSASATSETGEAGNYIVEYAISLEKMWEDGIFFGTPAEDAISIVADSTTVKMTASVSDDDNFDQDGVERSNDLTYFREIDGEAGEWDQSNYFSTLTFLEEFMGVIEVPGDCNGDGLVNSEDLQCACDSGSLETVLTVTGLEAGDLDGNGEVGFSDFLTLSANFGLEVPGYPDGDIDCDGTVGFPDFLALSANFGTTGGAAAAAVPEPSSWLLACLTSLMLFHVRKRNAGAWRTPTG